MYYPPDKVARVDDEERSESLNVPMASPVKRVISSPRPMRLGLTDSLRPSLVDKEPRSWSTTPSIESFIVLGVRLVMWQGLIAKP